MNQRKEEHPQASGEAAAFLRQWRIYGDPKPKGSMRWIGDRMVNDNPDCDRWIQDIRVQLVGRRMIDGPVGVKLRFLLPRGKSVKREQPCVKPDLDKLVRSVLDALTGCCYADDGQVVKVIALKEYADSTEPGCELSVYPVEVSNE